MSPSGLRTATDHAEGPRIITPSRTAWPPIGWLMLVLGSPAGLLEPALEALDSSAGVDELLLARVERVAFGANLDVQLGLRRTGLELGPARAAHGGEDVVRMDVGLHSPLRIAAAVSDETLPPETTTATAFPSTSGTFPERRAPTAAPAPGSAASFARA